MNLVKNRRISATVFVLMPILLLATLFQGHMVSVVTDDCRLKCDSLLTIVREQSLELNRLKNQVSIERYVLAPNDSLRVGKSLITLSDPYIRSQVQREMSYILDHRWALVEAWQNLGRYDSLMRSYFLRDSIPPNFRVMFISENYLRARGMSPKGAEGPCGIIESTGRLLKLTINKHVDERRAPVRAFDAASWHLKGSYRQFEDWLLSAAGYNRGDGGVNERLKTQGVESFFNVLLPDETQRYVYRFIALSLIDQQTDRFVPGLREVAQLPRFNVESRKVKLGRTTDISDLMKMVGLSPTTFWFYNMQFRGPSLPPGTYTVYLPR